MHTCHMTKDAPAVEARCCHGYIYQVLPWIHLSTIYPTIPHGWHDAFVWVTWLFQRRDTTQNVLHSIKDSGFTCVTYVIHMCVCKPQHFAFSCPLRRPAACLLRLVAATPRDVSGCLSKHKSTATRQLVDFSFNHTNCDSMSSVKKYL